MGAARRKADDRRAAREDHIRSLAAAGGDGHGVFAAHTRIAAGKGDGFVGAAVQCKYHRGVRTAGGQHLQCLIKVGIICALAAHSVGTAHRGLAAERIGADGVVGGRGVTGGDAVLVGDPCCQVVDTGYRHVGTDSNYSILERGQAALPLRRSEHSAVKAHVQLDGNDVRDRTGVHHAHLHSLGLADCHRTLPIMEVEKCGIELHRVLRVAAHGGGACTDLAGNVVRHICQNGAGHAGIIEAASVLRAIDVGGLDVGSIHILAVGDPFFQGAACASRITHILRAVVVVVVHQQVGSHGCDTGHVEGIGRLSVAGEVVVVEVDLVSGIGTVIYTVGRARIAEGDDGVMYIFHS